MASDADERDILQRRQIKTPPPNPMRMKLAPTSEVRPTSESVGIDPVGGAAGEVAKVSD
jgi:hypothetical protein